MDFEKELPAETRTPTLQDYDQAFYGFTRLLSSRINVGLDDGEYETRTEELFDQVRAFLSGFKSEETFPSALNCSNFLEDAIIELNLTMIWWDIMPHEGTQRVEEYIFGITSWISETIDPSS